MKFSSGFSALTSSLELETCSGFGARFELKISAEHALAMNMAHLGYQVFVSGAWETQSKSFCSFNVLIEARMIRSSLKILVLAVKTEN